MKSDVDALERWFRDNVASPVWKLAGGYPPEITATTEDILRLGQSLGVYRTDGVQSVPSELVPYLRAAIVRGRRRLALEVEQGLEVSSNETLIGMLHERLKPYQEMMASAWFVDGTPAQLPRLSDYLVLEAAQSLERADESSPVPARETDEKFHVLQSPRLFHADLDEARRQCEWRGLSCAIGFIDIDDFKAFNTEYTETIVDRRVLPAFMRRMEALIYARGYCYRYGGDEYMMLVHNAGIREASDFFETVRQAADDLCYPRISRKATVSIGAVVIQPDCYLTGRELESIAARAKARAKDAGKNRVVLVEDPKQVAT